LAQRGVVREVAREEKCPEREATGAEREMSDYAWAPEAEKRAKVDRTRSVFALRLRSAAVGVCGEARGCLGIIMCAQKKAARCGQSGENDVN
jgi:hypothetical protein